MRRSDQSPRLHRGTVGRKERFQDQRHDPYQARKKWPAGTRCGRCGAAYSDGRWTWEAAPYPAHETLCPACRRIEYDDPAGLVALSGPFFVAHRDEVLRLVRNIEAAESTEHPLERLIAIRDDAETTTIRTTGIHLARRIADALSSTFQGTTAMHYGDAEQSVRITWER